ncbi:MAG: DUF2199 domain-containing protein [Terracidiphilus sp.]
MADKVQCETHGETDQAFVCSHLARESHGLGFNCEEGSDESPFPDAWCDDCEIIRAAHGGWSDESQELVKIALVCTKCYERTRIRNTKPAVTLDDLANLRWKCPSCEEWHYGPCLDFGFSAPSYWSSSYDRGKRWAVTEQGEIEKSNKSFLDEDYCAVDDEHFFVRGVLHLRIVGTDETLRWGIWGSLSRANFEILLKLDASGESANLEPMFSWLSSRIPDYPDTPSVKMHARIQEPGMRPHFELEPTDHPLAQEFHHGILPERVREIMLRELRNAGQQDA